MHDGSGWMDNGYYYVGGGIGIFLLIIILICIVWALQWPSCGYGDPSWGWGGGGGAYFYPSYNGCFAPVSASYGRVPCDAGGPDLGPRVCAVTIDSRYVEDDRGGGARRGPGESRGGSIVVPTAPTEAEVLVGGAGGFTRPV